MNQKFAMQIRLLAFSVVVLLVGTACVNTSHDQRSRQAARVHADQQWIEEQMQRLQGRLDNTEMQMEELHRQIDRLREDVRRAGGLQESALTLKVNTIEARMAQLEAARDRDRQEIVDQISQRVSGMMATSTAAAPAARPRRPISTTGYEHVVETGQTLSHIAQAYGVSVKAIVDANDLKDPNNLRVGQKLFIPE